MELAAAVAKTVIVLAGCACAAAIVAIIVRHLEQFKRGLPVRLIMWALLASTSIQSLAYRNGWDTVQSLLYDAGTIALPVISCGLIGAAIPDLRRWSPIAVCLLAYSAVEIVSAYVNAEVFHLSPIKTSALLYLPSLVIYVWGQRLSADEVLTLVQRLLLITVWASIVLTCIAPTLSVTDLPRRIAFAGFHYRFAGITAHPNLLGWLAGVLALLVTKFRQRFWFIHLVGCLVAIALGEARNVAITLVVIGLVAWVFNGEHRRWRIAFAVPTLGVFAILAAPFAELIAVDDGASIATFSDRTTIWGVALEYWWHRAVLGWGPFAFDHQLQTPFSIYYFQNAHNQFLQALVEGGVMGEGALVLIVGLIFWNAFKAHEKALHLSFAFQIVVFMLTEVPLTAQIYGFNFVVFVLAAALMMLRASDLSAHCDRTDEHPGVIDNLHRGRQIDGLWQKQRRLSTHITLHLSERELFDDYCSHAFLRAGH